MQCVCVRVLGVVVLLPRFSTFGWADVRIIPFLSLLVVAVALLWCG
jgi:hypothetical protein